MSNLLDVFATPWAVPPAQLRDMGQAVLSFIEAGARADRLPAPPTHPAPYVDGGIAIVTMTGPLIHRPHPVLAALFGALDPAVLAADIHQLAADESVRGIALDIDSPGGSVSGTPTLHRAVARANAVKPVVAVVEGMCTSAAFWVASGCRAIFATEDSAQVGSVGVIATHMDRSRALDARGLTVSEITAGRYKASTSPNRPLSEDGRDSLQQMVDTIYSHFLAAVADARGTTAGDVHARWAEGRVWLASEARRNGLIDGIVAREEVLATMAAELT